MKKIIKKIGNAVLDVCCNYDCFQEYMRSHGTLYGEYKFIPSNQNWSIQQVLMEYDFKDVKKTDVVLDIGANIEGFSILVSGDAKMVYSVEPLYHEILEKNIKNNHITNIKVIKCGLGEGITHLGFVGKSTDVMCYGLKYIIDTFCGGHVDFLKLDCEGGEWFIKPDDLMGIRRIECELHNFDGSHDFNMFLKMLSNAGYNYEYTQKK